MLPDSVGDASGFDDAKSPRCIPCCARGGWSGDAYPGGDAIALGDARVSVDISRLLELGDVTAALPPCRVRADLLATGGRSAPSCTIAGSQKLAMQRLRTKRRSPTTSLRRRATWGRRMQRSQRLLDIIVASSQVFKTKRSDDHASVSKIRRAWRLQLSTSLPIS